MRHTNNNKCIADHLVAKRLLFVCEQAAHWFCWRRTARHRSTTNQWHMLRQVNNYYSNSRTILFLSIWKLKWNNFVFSIRGALNAILETSVNFAFIISFLLGTYVDISEQAKMYLIVPSVAAVLLFFLPESPVFLAKKGKEEVSDHWSNNSSQCVPFT